MLSALKFEKSNDKEVLGQHTETPKKIYLHKMTKLFAAI